MPASFSEHLFLGSLLLGLLVLVLVVIAGTIIVVAFSAHPPASSSRCGLLVALALRPSFIHLQVAAREENDRESVRHFQLLPFSEKNLKRGNRTASHRRSNE